MVCCEVTFGLGGVGLVLADCGFAGLLLVLVGFDVGLWLLGVGGWLGVSLVGLLWYSFAGLVV